MVGVQPGITGGRFKQDQTAVSSHPDAAGLMGKVCFVCGGVPARQSLLTRQLVDPIGMCPPYFPFLEKHSPPQGAERPSADGRILACNVCHAILQQQWEAHEIQRTPHSKRTYWLKRVDNGPFSGLDLRQEDYQNPSADQQQQNQHQQYHPPSGGYRRTPPAKDFSSRAPLPLSLSESDSNAPNILDLSKPAGRMTPDKINLVAHNRGSTANNNSGCGGGGNKNNNNNNSNYHSNNNNNNSNYHSNNNNNNTIAYDYSKHSSRRTPERKEGDRVPEVVPARDATATETSDVCFVCGGQVSRGSLLNIFARPIANCPFFPSLLKHEQPPRSFPVDQATGRIKACQSCHAFLLHQWDAYQKLNVAPTDRHYLMPPTRASGCPALPMGSLAPPSILHKPKSVVAPTAAPPPPSVASPNVRSSSSPVAGNFVCYTCANELPTSIHRVVATSPSPNSNEPYFGFLKQLVPPPGAQSLNVVGQAIVCSLCYKNLLRQHRVFEISEVPEQKRNYKVMINETGVASTPVAPSNPLPPPTTGAAAAAAAASNPKSAVSAVSTSSAQPARTTSHKLATTNPLSRPSNGPKYVGCYICEKIGPKDKLLAVDTKFNREGRPFFPVIEDLPRPIAAMPMDSGGKALLCTECRNNLVLQWSTFEASGIAYKHRNYQVNTNPSPTGSCLPRAPVIAQPSSQASTGGGRGESALRVQVSAPPHAAEAGGGQLQTLLTTVSSSSTYTGPTVVQASPAAAAATPFVGLDLKVSRPKAATSPASLSKATKTKEMAGPIPPLPPSAEHVCFFCLEHTSTMYSVCSKQVDDQSPFFPIITQIAEARRASLPQEIDPSDGTVFACSFCYHSLMAQWSAYEVSPHQEDRDRATRKYNTHDYVCYICGIITYRKRVRSISVKDFPFLVAHPRPGGALQLHQFESVVTCLTCFEGLTSQWREYERLRVPLEMRQYNWITVPPPPEQDEDSNGAPSSAEGFPAANPSPHGNGPASAGGKQTNRAPNQAQSGTQFGPLNGFLPQGNGGRVLGAARTSSYAAALRKLAKQAVDPADVGKEPRSPGLAAMSPSPLPNGAVSSNASVPLPPSSSTSSAMLTIPSSSAGIMSSTSTSSSKKHCSSLGAGLDARKPIDLTSTTPEPQSTMAHKKQQPSPSRGFQPYRAGSSSIISNGSSVPVAESVSPTLIPHPSPLAPSYDYNQYLLHHHQQMAAVQGGHPAFRLDDPMLFDPRYAPQLSYPYIPTGAPMSTQRKDETKRTPTSRGSIIQGTPRSEASTSSTTVSLAKSLAEPQSETVDMSAYNLAGLAGAHNDPQWFAQARLDIEKRKELQFQHELYLREQQGVGRVQSQASARNARSVSQEHNKGSSCSPHPQPVGGLQHHQSSKFMQVTPHSSGTRGAKMTSLATSLAGQPMSMAGLPIQGLNLSHASSGVFTQILPNAFNENNNVINFGEEGMHARLLETQNKHKVVKPTVIQQNGMPPFYSPFSADSLLGHPALPYGMPTPYGPAAGAAAYAENVGAVEREQLIVDAPLFGLAPKPAEPNEEGITSALDLQIKDKDAFGGYVDRDLEIFKVSWTGPKAKLECDEKKLDFLESFGLTTHIKVKQIQCQQFVNKRKHSDDLLTEETAELPEKFWKRLLLLDGGRLSIPETCTYEPKSAHSPLEPRFLEALELCDFRASKTDVELKWRAVLKDRSRRHHISLPEPKKNYAAQERASEEFDESLLKKARFDPKSFAQEFHESVLKDTREKLGYVETRSPEKTFSDTSLTSFSRIVDSITSNRDDSRTSASTADVERKRAHPAFRVQLGCEEDSSSPPPESSQTPFEWPGVDAVMEAVHRYHNIFIKEQRYLGEKVKELNERSIQLEQEFDEVKSQFKRLEEQTRIESLELDKKKRDAERLLAQVKFIRQMGPNPSTTSIANGHC